ncbi:MAG: diguanylate cyclase [Bauldia sp.]
MASQRARREQRSYALCLVDLDRFKAVNDNAGHAAGDALLRRIADVLRRSCRRQDFAARIGGDEFALLLSDCSASAAAHVMQEVVDAVATLGFEWDGTGYSVGASIGITTIGSDSPGLPEIMSQADAACYTSKAAGRGRVSVYDPVASAT